MEALKAKYFLVILPKWGGGNETHSHLQRPRTPSCTTLDTLEKQILTKNL
jgi:hypothetical protein